MINVGTKYDILDVDSKIQISNMLQAGIDNDMELKPANNVLNTKRKYTKYDCQNIFLTAKQTFTVSAWDKYDPVSWAFKSDLEPVIHADPGPYRQHW